MKYIFSTAILFVLALSLVTVANAQKPKSKDDLFKEIATLSNTKKPEDTAKAYELARDFLNRFGKDKDDRVPKIKTFFNNYRQSTLYLAVDGKKYAEAFKIGQEILAEQPDNVEIYLNLAYAGYNSFVGTRDKTYNDVAAGYALKALQLIDAGTLPKVFDPFKTKDEAISFMHYAAGTLTFEKEMRSAASEIYKATLTDSVIKNSAEPYYMISAYYEALYEKMSTELKAKVAAKTVSDADFKVESGKIDKVIDLMMDAYARASKRGEAEKNPAAAAWKDRLVQVYKFKNKTDAGLAEFITYANTMPMPDPGK